MIIARSPLRISLGGGGTDLPSWYGEHGGFLISAAIDKYVYILVHETFGEEMLIKYSRQERVTSLEEIQHPIIREALRLLDIAPRKLEICSMADIPAGTGLGSSGTFTVGLLKALHAWKGDIVSTRTLAEEACEIEMNRLGEPVGKQDQYIAAYGGITCMDFHRDGYVWVDPLGMDDETLYNLEDHLLLFFTGYARSASSILAEQDKKSREHDSGMAANLEFVKELGLKSRKAFEEGSLEEFARIMNVHWEYKKQRSGGMSNPQINAWYDLAMANGAKGGKLIGAGGGGFLLFYAEDKIRLRRVLREAGLQEVRFRFEKEGAKIIG